MSESDDEPEMRLRVASPLTPRDEELVRAVIRCGIQVHTTLGCGFSESIYHRAMDLELAGAGIEFSSELSVPVLYRGRTLGAHRLDLLIGPRLVVELKAVEQLYPVHVAQVLSYLRAAKHPVGLLLNFGSTRLGIRRIVRPGTSRAG